MRLEPQRQNFAVSLFFPREDKREGERQREEEEQEENEEVLCRLSGAEAEGRCCCQLEQGQEDSEHDCHQDYSAVLALVLDSRHSHSALVWRSWHPLPLTN
jgi:hypothetical protein